MDICAFLSLVFSCVELEKEKAPTSHSNIVCFNVTDKVAKS